MESSTVRKEKLQRRRERERAHRAAETAADKEERTRKHRETRKGELQKHTENRVRQDFRESALLRQSESSSSETEEQ